MRKLQICYCCCAKCGLFVVNCTRRDAIFRRRFYIEVFVICWINGTVIIWDPIWSRADITMTVVVLQGVLSKLSSINFKLRHYACSFWKTPNPICCENATLINGRYYLVLAFCRGIWDITIEKMSKKHWWFFIIMYYLVIIKVLTRVRGFWNFLLSNRRFIKLWYQQISLSFEEILIYFLFSFRTSHILWLLLPRMSK